ncbi:hypothetical protein MRB53_041348 [Persea americana]|nr:hypothetical protein MRB53_041348 [Persea americana]
MAASLCAIPVRAFARPGIRVVPLVPLDSGRDPLDHLDAPLFRRLLISIRSLCAIATPHWCMSTIMLCLASRFRPHVLDACFLSCPPPCHSLREISVFTCSRHQPSRALAAMHAPPQRRISIHREARQACHAAGSRGYCCMIYYVASRGAKACLSVVYTPRLGIASAGLVKYCTLKECTVYCTTNSHARQNKHGASS